MNLYLEAAAILESPQNTSLKSIIYKPSKPFKSPQSKLYALIVETLKFQDILKEVIENAGILKIERKLTPLLSILLVHDLLLTKSGIAASSGPLKDAVLRHKARLSSEFTRARIRRGHADVKALRDAVNLQHEQESEYGVSTSSTGLTSFNPRWIRVNTLKTSMANALESSTFASFDNVSGMSDMFFSNTVEKFYYSKDYLLPNIFSIHPSHDIISSELYKSGAIILQSAASCLPAIMLNPPKGSIVVDGCAAPGNKTTHLAALVGPSGRVFAVERDKDRAEVLEKMVKRAAADKIVTILKATDFTTIAEDHEAWEARYLLLDPSCSGSGILQRIDWDISKLNLPSAHMNTGKTSKPSRKRKREEPQHLQGSTEPDVQTEETLDEDTTKERLQSLSDFQLAIILHAFAFPNAERVTYSTCSIHAIENEGVVIRALNSEIAQKRGWTVQSRQDNPLSAWHRRGLVEEFSELDASEEERSRVSEGCVRVNRTDSLGGGFFVVCFVRNLDSDDQLDTHSDVQHPSTVGSEGYPARETGRPALQVENEEWRGFSDTGSKDALCNKASKKKKKKKEKEKMFRSKGEGNKQANSQFQKRKRGWS
ncbi:hypothetical protein AA313_de0210164 [Arthrobotrys entomopaga]|nr:hypothetical protein AA313_de0210164 [Arthrobotrys entomopaga]